MKFIDVFTSDQCIDIFESVNEFSTNHLKQYNDSIESLGFHFKPKDIFDFIWGTVELSAVEICLIDSPIIQRLRNIQQLGFASYVYCNADYSRFAHTIGVVEAADRITKVITRKLKQQIPNRDTYDMNEIVRLSAIFHDAGHMFYSHVSESFFTVNQNFAQIDKVTAALTFFSENISTRAAFHEMISVMIVNADEVRRFFRLTAPYLSQSRILNNDECDMLIAYISGLIVGTAVDKNILPYSKVIKGPIDADRLDYLSRDSAITKVPLAVDIARLIHKITVVALDDYEPARVWNDYSPEDLPYQSMAIHDSAQGLIWQLSLARSILYQSVYFHHKKLTAEAMFKKACENIFAIMPQEKLNFAYILSLKDQAMSEYFQNVVIPVAMHHEKKFMDAVEIMTRIRDRNLYKRVASFSQDVFSSPNYIYEIFVTDIIENPFSDAHTLFVNHLVNEYFAVLDTLQKQRPLNAPVFMFIEANWQNDMVADIPVDCGNAPYKMFSQVFKETPTFDEENKQKQYYLITDQQERAFVYIALERVLSIKHGMRIIESASACAKFTLEQLSEVRRKLSGIDHFLNRNLL